MILTSPIFKYQTKNINDSNGNSQNAVVLHYKVTHVRARRGTEERIVPERLERESPEEPGDAVVVGRMMRLRMLRAVVDEHGDGRMISLSLSLASTL